MEDRVSEEPQHMIDVDKFMERIEKEMINSFRCTLCKKMNLIGLYGLECDGCHFLCQSCYNANIRGPNTVFCPTCLKDCQKTGDLMGPLDVIMGKMDTVKDLVKKKIIFFICDLNSCDSIQKKKILASANANFHCIIHLNFSV